MVVVASVPVVGVSLVVEVGVAVVFKIMLVLHNEVLVFFLDIFESTGIYPGSSLGDHADGRVLVGTFELL